MSDDRGAGAEVAGRLHVPGYQKDLEVAFAEWRRLTWVNRGLRSRRRVIGEINYPRLL